MSLGKIAKSGFWLYTGSLISALLGFVYWLLISRVAGPAVVGVASTTVGLSLLVSQSLNLGIPTGIERSFGKAIGSNDFTALRAYLASSLLLMTIMSIVGAMSIIVGHILGLIMLEESFVAMAAVLVLLNGPYAVFYPFFRSSLRTRVIFLVIGIGSAVKLVVGVILVYLGWGEFGATLGFVIQYLLMLIGMILAWSALYGMVDLRFSQTIMKEVTSASIPSWIPGILSAIGQWAGVLAIFGYSGPFQTGLYYVAFAISGLVTTIAQGALSLVFPVLSGMTDGRKRASWKATKVAMAVVSPLALLLVIYPQVPLSLLGQNYLEASGQLSILALSAPFIALFTGVWGLAYAYGYYRLVLLTNLASALPQLALYLLLVPSMGGMGAAIGFLTGALAGAFFATICSHQIGLKIDWKTLALTVTIPSVLACILFVSHIHWALASLLLLAISALGYTRLGIVSRAELKELGSAFLSKESLRRLYPYTPALLRILYGNSPAEQDSL